MPRNVGITFSWRIRPVCEPLIAVQKSRRNGSSSGSLGMPVWRKYWSRMITTNSSRRLPWRTPSRPPTTSSSTGYFAKISVLR